LSVRYSTAPSRRVIRNRNTIRYILNTPNFGSPIGAL
jgi:hypothetical protein